MRSALRSITTLAGLAVASTATASSHNDAPLIKLDPQANLTDVYAFVGVMSGDPSTEVLNVIVNVRPFSEPGDGPHYERFSPDALYSIHITNPADATELVRYDFRFSPVDAGYKNTGTILSYGLGLAAGPIMNIGDDQQNYTQTYDLNRTADGASVLVADDALVAPPNVGANVTPLYNDAMGRAISGAMSDAELDAYTAQAITGTADGGVAFAGPRDDSFFSDIPGVFDLLNVRILDNNGSLEDGLGQDAGGVDGFKGFNVLTYAVQIPLEDLPALPYSDAFFGPQTGVGVYASVSRPVVTTRLGGGATDDAGGFVQVNRLGNPLFNEALVALADKDSYNAASPADDDQFAMYATDPELAFLVNFVYGTSFAETGRADLEAVFIPDVLRVATTTGPVSLAGDPGFSRLGFIGGDTTSGVNSGWPNGRRMGDDVIDIALTALASGPTYESITVVGDNVAGNDVAYNRVFPYAATPHSGTFNRKDPAPTDFEVSDRDGNGKLDFNDVIAFIETFWRAVNE